MPLPRVSGVPLCTQCATTKGRWSSTGHTTCHYQGSVEFHWAHNVSLPRVGGAPHGWAQLCGCVRDGANPLWKPGTPFTTATLDSTTPVKQNMFHYNSGQTFGCVDKAGRIYAVVDYCIRQSPAHHCCSFEKHNCTGIVSFLSPPIPILFHLLLIPIPSPLDSHVVSPPHSRTVSPPCSHTVSRPRSCTITSWFSYGISSPLPYCFTTSFHC